MNRTQRPGFGSASLKIDLNNNEHELAEGPIIHYVKNQSEQVGVHSSHHKNEIMQVKAVKAYSSPMNAPGKSSTSYNDKSTIDFSISSK